MMPNDTSEAIGQLAQGLAGLVAAMATQQPPGVGDNPGLAALLAAVSHAIAVLDGMTQNSDPMVRLSLKKASIAARTAEMLVYQRR